MTPAPTAQNDNYWATVIRWVDGDTLEVDSWQEAVTSAFRSYDTTIEHITRTSQDKKGLRLIIIDTPERGKPGYKEARAYSEALVPPGSLIRYTAHGDDDAGWGRTLADVFLPEGTTGISETLLREGVAKVWTPR